MRPCDLIKAKEGDRQDSRERILAAATRVFSRKGFQRASLDEIAAEADLTKGAIYWHFRSKNDLFSALLQRRFQKDVAPIPAELAAALSGADTETRRHGVARMLTGMLQRFREDEHWPRLYLEFLSQSRDPEIGQGTAALFGHGRRLARDMAVQMQRAGLVREDMDADMLSSFWCALIDGYMMAWVVAPEDFDADRRMDQLVDMLWRGMAPGQ